MTSSILELMAQTALYIGVFTPHRHLVLLVGLHEPKNLKLCQLKNNS
ncbi:MAG: hypothetical protein JWP78_3878 [Mucilaginibacter sp.]|nr:hypothetical protein [Mucilaginibacter sp.]